MSNTNEDTDTKKMKYNKIVEKIRGLIAENKSENHKNYFSLVSSDIFIENNKCYCNNIVHNIELLELLEFYENNKNNKKTGGFETINQPYEQTINSQRMLKKRNANMIDSAEYTNVKDVDVEDTEDVDVKDTEDVDVEYTEDVDVEYTEDVDVKDTEDISIQTIKNNIVSDYYYIINSFLKVLELSINPGSVLTIIESYPIDLINQYKRKVKYDEDKYNKVKYDERICLDVPASVNFNEFNDEEISSITITLMNHLI